MSWHRIDDTWRHHHKTRRAVRLGGRDALTVWCWVGNAVAEAGSDGVASLDMLEDCADALRMSQAEMDAATEALGGCGFWHDRTSITACHCKVAKRHLEARGAFFHDWCDWNIPRDASRIPIERLREMRRRELLHNRKLCEAIVARDGEQCRYCGERVNFGDRRGKRGGTYDHLDPALFEPNMGNFLDGIVVACRQCNGQKKNRTPAEWLAAGGRPLLPVAEPYLLDPDLSATRSGSDHDLDEPGHDLTSRAHAARDGSGLDGSGPDQTPTRSRSGRDQNREVAHA